MTIKMTISNTVSVPIIWHLLSEQNNKQNHKRIKLEYGSLIQNDITFSLKSKERYNPASFRWRGWGDRKIVSQSHCFQYREREENFYWAQSGYYSRVERNQPRTVKGRTPDATLLNAKIFFGNCGSFSKGSSYEGKIGGPFSITRVVDQTSSRN